MGSEIGQKKLKNKITKCGLHSNGFGKGSHNSFWFSLVPNVKGILECQSAPGTAQNYYLPGKTQKVTRW
jgi:hypothetical protein